jgi:hypothetical protein
MANNALLGLHVDTYLNDPKEAITLDVQFETLPNGIVYTARTQLDAAAKHVTVVVENSGYRDLKS